MKEPPAWSAKLVICATLSASAASHAAERGQTGASVEQRIERLERILRNQSLSDIVLQLQQLQQEVQQLRGELELQSHTLDALNKRQRELYLDIDQRLSNLRPMPGAPVAPESATVPSGQPETGASAAEYAPAGAMVVEPSRQTGPAPVVPPDPKKEADAYQHAFNLLKQGRYKESIGAFRDFLSRYPGGTYEDNAQYWLGEASYVDRDFDTALVEFSRVVENYPASSKVPGAMLKSGYIHYEKRNWAQARELFKRLQQSYAGSTEARLAGKRLQRMEKEGH